MLNDSGEGNTDEVVHSTKQTIQNEANGSDVDSICCPHVCFLCRSKFSSCTKVQIHVLKHHSSKLESIELDASPENDVFGLDSEVKEDSDNLGSYDGGRDGLEFLDILNVDLKTSDIDERSEMEGTEKDEAKKPVFSCNICQKPFRSKQSLKKHKSEKHSRRSNCSVTCDFCDSVFTSEDLFHSHNCKSFDSKKTCFQCYICQYKFIARRQTIMHLKSVHGIQQIPLDFWRNNLLVYCCGELRDIANLDAHKLNCQINKTDVKGDADGDTDGKDLKLPDDLSCNDCDKVFNSMSKLLTHLRLVHEKKSVCHLCGRSVNDLTKHIRQSHGDDCQGVSLDDKPFQCSQCPTSFWYRSKLNDHVKLKHTGEIQFTCEICGKSYSSKDYLKIHVDSIHKGEKKFPCKICNKAFGDPRSVHTHMKYVHSSKKFNKCTMCKEKFDTRALLNEHVNLVHGGKRKHQCTECPLSFHTRCHLQQHVDGVHLKLKKFECKTCGKRFTQGGTLTKHERLHKEQT